MGLGSSTELAFEPVRSWRDEGLQYILSPSDSQLLAQLTQSEGAPLWPDPWDRLLPQSNQKIISIWTYFELAHDVGGSPSPERRTLWINILGSLQWPKGSILFWPFNVYSGEQLLSRIDTFWEGVHYLQPSHIVLFGRRAFETFFPSHTFTIGEFQFAPLPCWVLPGPEDMLPDNRDKKRTVWQHLTQCQKRFL